MLGTAWACERAPDVSEPRPPLRVGLTQWHATDDLDANLDKADAAIARASSEGAQLVLLPENGLMLASGPRMRESALDAQSPAVARLAAAAKQHGVAVILGGAKFRADGRITNRALVFDASGNMCATYDKIHLFDARVGGQSFEASRVEEPGGEPVVVRLGDWNLGLTICYDVRFPELYRALARHGAEVLLVPAAFTRTTGRAHWETLLRARAIENGCYVVASATVTPEGVEGDAFETFGHAMVVDPWGAVVADLGERDDEVVVVSLAVDAVVQARTALPVLEQCRPDAYATTVRSVDIVGRGSSGS